MSFKIFSHKLTVRKQKKHWTRFCSKLFKVSTTSVTLPEKHLPYLPTFFKTPRISPTLFWRGPFSFFSFFFVNQREINDPGQGRGYSPHRPSLVSATDWHHDNTISNRTCSTNPVRRRPGKDHTSSHFTDVLHILPFPSTEPCWDRWARLAGAHPGFSQGEDPSRNVHN